MSYTSLKIPLTFYHPQESLPIGMQILQRTIEKGRKWPQIKNTSNANDVYKVNGETRNVFKGKGGGRFGRAITFDRELKTIDN